jgi:hypothetical protein
VRPAVFERRRPRARSFVRAALNLDAVTAVHCCRSRDDGQAPGFCLRKVRRRAPRL